MRRSVRAAEGAGLENQWAEMSRGFESHGLRHRSPQRSNEERSHWHSDFQIDGFGIAGTFGMGMSATPSIYVLLAGSEIQIVAIAIRISDMLSQRI